jgi:hypothetical protein
MTPEQFTTLEHILWVICGLLGLILGALIAK